MLRTLSKDTVEGIVGGIPIAWEVSPAARAALVEQIMGRAGFLADRIDEGWIPNNP
jgi:hypothetical protein